MREIDWKGLRSSSSAAFNTSNYTEQLYLIEREEKTNCRQSNDGNGWKIFNFFFFGLPINHSINQLLQRNWTGHSPCTPNFGLPNSRWNWLTRSTSIFIFSLLLVLVVRCRTVLWLETVRRFWILHWFLALACRRRCQIRTSLLFLALAHTEYIFRYTHELTWLWALSA